MIEAVYRLPFRSRHTSAHSITNLYPNDRAAASLVGNDGFRRYSRLSGYMPNSEMICLPVSKLLSRAESLLAEFEQGGGTSYVQNDDPVTLAREVLEICLPPGDPKRPVAFTFLATHLVIRYERLGGIRDLDEVLVRVLSREARGFCPQGHPDHTMSLKCHGPAACLSARYEQLRPTQDLDVPVAIVPGYPNHSTSLSNPVHLSTRHNQLGAMIDLEADLSTCYN